MINSFDDYEMFSAEGNQAVTSLVDRVSGALLDGASREEALEMLRVGINEIAKEHGEVHDTAVEESICGTLDTEFEDQGFQALERGEF